MMQEVYTDTFCSVNILQLIRRNYVMWTPALGRKIWRKMKKIICPKCGMEMIEDNISQKEVKSYEDCIRKCKKCEIGASNAKVNPTIIYKDFKLNIPHQLLDNLEYTLNNSNNIRNRARNCQLLWIEV